MSFAWMRRIDSWIGKPVTHLLGWFTPRSRSLQGDQRLTQIPKRIICTKFIGLGSVVLSLPLLKALKESGATIAFWTFPGQAEIVRLSGFVDEVFIIRPSVKSFISTLWSSWRAARKFQAGAFLDLEPTANFSAILARLSGAPLRVGFMSAKPAREALFTHLVALTADRHMITNNWLQGELIGLSPKDHVGSNSSIWLPELKFSTPKKQASIYQKQIVINVNSSDLSWHRMWIAEHWVNLCQKLLLDRDVTLIFPGAASERERTQAVIDSIIARVPNAGSRIFNLAGKTSITELLAVLKNSDLVVSVDSGIMHLAAWSGTPLVALFGPETPTLFAPRSVHSRVFWAALPCSPCLSVAADKITRCRDNQCLRSISPDLVYATCNELLAIKHPLIKAA